MGILLEELGVPYDAWPVPLDGSQFGSGFVALNPNSKIPALRDGGTAVFESAAIMVHLADAEKRFMPTAPELRGEVMQWLFWQMAGQGPMTGNLMHFWAYAPETAVEARDYGVARYGLEVQRLCSVLDRHLASREWMVGGEYSIADMACWPWANLLIRRKADGPGRRGLPSRPRAPVVAHPAAPGRRWASSWGCIASSTWCGGRLALPRGRPCAAG